jgi:hypothetical protein
MTVKEELREIFKQKNWPGWLARNRPLLLAELKRLTNFVPEDFPLVVRAWHITNEVFTIPKCALCDQVVFLRKKQNTYSDYCRECARKVEQQNREKAVLKKYGTRQILSVGSIRESIKKTNLKKYGVEFVSQSKIIRDKIENTVKEKYGVSNPSQADSVKQKKIIKSMKVYGVANPLMVDEIKDKIKETNKEKYGTQNAMQSDKIKNKNKATCLQKYGVEFHVQKNLSNEALEVLNSKDILIDMHHNKKMTQGEIAKIIDVTQTTVSNYCFKHNIEVKHYFRSAGEKELFDFVLSSFPNAIPNYRKIAGVELDCFIPDISLAIEYNGVYWHSEKVGKTQNFHADKYNLCKDNGIRLITIFENEWTEKNDLVKLKLLNIFGKSQERKIFARKTTICEVSTKDKNNFFDLYHIQESGPSSINFGLMSDNDLVACMGFIKYNDYYVLNRYASSCNVVGGFTKLLTHFENKFDKPKIVTFADLRWSGGDLYHNSKFKLDSVLEPDYSWVKDGKVWHKFSWRHTSGLKKLQNYDPNKSEIENMHAHGFYRLWDCGKLRFVKNT